MHKFFDTLHRHTKIVISYEQKVIGITEAVSVDKPREQISAKIHFSFELLNYPCWGTLNTRLLTVASHYKHGAVKGSPMQENMCRTKCELEAENILRRSNPRFNEQRNFKDRYQRVFL